MNNYKKIYDTCGLLKVLCTLLAVLYIAYWFLKLIQMPYVEYAAFAFEPPLNLIKFFINWELPYGGQIIDMTSIIAALVLQVFHYVFQFCANVVERMEKRHQLSVIEERKIAEKLVNQDLKEIFKKKTLRYSRFAILLNLELKPTIDPNIINEDFDPKDLAMKQYVNIVTAMRQKYPACKAITPGKLFVIFDNFAMFDDFFTDIIKEVKTVCEKNREKNISTNFMFALEAMDDGDKIARVLDLLEKIMTFNYANKAVTTSAFQVRYNLNQKRKYTLDTMGISRLYEKNEEGAQVGTDFELYCLKTTKKH